MILFLQSILHYILILGGKIMSNVSAPNPNPASGPTKICKYCKSEIPKDAKICPHCRKKQGGKLKWIIIAIVVILIFAAIGGSGSSSSSSSTSSAASSSAKAETVASSASEPAEVTIEYTAYSVDDMVSDLQSNALSASNKYKDQYIEITGRLSNIDSSGEYITLSPIDDPYSFVSVMCYIQNDEQTQRVMQMSTDETITLRGKCTDVGEVLGYYLDIDSID